jgi:solute:Na+ symporter, SSS family
VRSVQLIDLVVLVFYMALMLGIGVYFRRFMKGAKEYFAGGNMIPWWVGGISLYMSSFTAWTFTGAAGFVYHTGWFGLIYFITWPVAYFLGYRLTASKWRRSRVLSPVEYVSTRFNPMTQQILSYILITSGLLTRGITLTAVCKIISASVGWPIEYMIIGTGLVMLLYTLHGGLWAVSVTDVVQFIFLFVITVIVTPLCISKVGGLAALVDKMPALSFNHDYAGMTYDINYLIAFTLINVLNVNWAAAQRYYSVKDEKDARRVGLFCSALFLTAPILFGLPPLAARLMWPNLANLPFFAQSSRPEDLIYLGIVLTWIPNGMIGFFLAAMFSATMSTLSGAYNVDSSIIARDLYKGVLKPNASDQDMLRVGKIATIFLGLITIVTALIYAKSTIGIFNLMVVFVSLFQVPIAVPMIFGLIFKKPSRWAALAAMLSGLAASFILRFAVGLTVGPQIYGTFIVTFLVLIFFHLVRKDSPEERAVVDEFFKRLAVPIDVAKEVLGGGKKMISAYPIVGVNTILIGLVIVGLAFVPTADELKMVNIYSGGFLALIGCVFYYLGKRVK